jgi:hypothetical protein
MEGPFDQFVGMDDPQLLGQLLMACALSWFLARDSRGLSAEPPILMMVVAGFWKHNIIAIPITVLLWLILRDGRRAIRPCLVGLGGCWSGSRYAGRYMVMFSSRISLGRANLPHGACC